MPSSSSRIPGFYRLSPAERRRKLLELAGLPPEGFAAVDPGALTIDTADGMIENVVGVYGLPFAVAVNFAVDGTEPLVPMVVEEPSIVAAASNAARMVRPRGFATVVSAPVMIGQIQVTDLGDVDAAAARLRAHAEELLGDARRLVPRLAERGGGPIALDVRPLTRSGPDGGVIVVHLHVDCRDAMGANLVNTLCEALAGKVAELADGRPGLRILSNLTDGRTVTVRCSVDDAALACETAEGEDVRSAIAAASRFAELDPYRAATHNKGIMNGVDAVALATGNDWRAIEAGAHAYACRDGRYTSLTTWRIEDEHLVGAIELPMAVSTVGPLVKSHPRVRLAFRLLGVSGARELAGIMAAAGLASNMAAMRALATEGIQKGHMSLHARSVLLAAGARGAAVEQLRKRLVAAGDVKIDRAIALLRTTEPTS